MFPTLEDTKCALYDLKKDPGQLSPVNDIALMTKYKNIMLEEIKTYDPPEELLKNYF